MSSVQVVWFKRDLRVVDHEPLVRAAERGPVLPLYVVEPGLWAEPDRSLRHWRFLRGCLEDLDEALVGLGGRLRIEDREMLSVLEALKREFGAFALWAHEETGTAWTYRRDLAVHAWCRTANVPFTELPQHGVVRRLQDRDGWARRWDRFMARPMEPLPERIAFVPVDGPRPAALPDPLTRGDAQRMQAPGRDRALAVLDSFLERRGEDYTRGMSSPVTGIRQCSRISPYLASGILSMRETAQRARARKQALRDLSKEERGNWGKALSSFTGRLHWHCHFMQKLESEPRIEFENLARTLDGLREEAFDESLFRAWCLGETGYPFVDACMRSLNATGWLNFRMRAMLVSFAAYDLWLHWRRPALHLARQFLDYEPGIHFSQMQMQSGTTGMNTMRIYSPVKQSRDQDPDGTFLRRWVPELAALPTEHLHEPWKAPPLVLQAAGVRLGEDYPEPVVDHGQAVKAARARLAAVRGTQQAREERDRNVEKHGSRRRPRRHAGGGRA
jgi:deoxyribodipyrimidine photo-lyase